MAQSDAADWLDSAGPVHLFAVDWANLCDGGSDGSASSLLQFVTCAACLERQRDTEMATEWS